MKEYKNEVKNKEIIIGLIIIIILGSIALFLLIKRELQYKYDSKVILKNETIFKDSLVNGEETERKQEEQPLLHTDVMGKTGDQKEIFQKKEINTSESLGNKIVEEKKTANKQSGSVNIKEEKKENKTDPVRFSLYSVLGSEKYSSFSVKRRNTEDGQMKELYEYWDAYRLDAVGDLIRLERIKKISDELKDTGYFYYYGSSDALGRPSGKGLAIYQDNTYYFGEWKEGMREGNGMWLQVAIYEDEFLFANLGLIEHSYNGEWKNDLPNGEGQEHFSYHYDTLKEDYLKDGFCIANVLGNFKNGYYDGEMYIMTTDEKGDTRDWSGECNMGSWNPIMVGKTTDAVWESYDTDETGNHSYHYVRPVENKNYGIFGLKK